MLKEYPLVLPLESLLFCVAEKCLDLISISEVYFY